MKRLKCFIACAFGYKDVDAIYINGIKTVLKSLDIVPLRVDEINHNDNIDTKIIKLIDESDFCIGDLTYARPSVYYEAGYASGLQKPVIFTVRKDHFKLKESDQKGFEKVHFDLQMKNIIDWSSVKQLEVFKKRLSQRIALVTKPIIEKNNQNILIEQEREIFLTLSLKEKVDITKDQIINNSALSTYKLYNKPSMGLRLIYINPITTYINQTKKSVIGFDFSISAVKGYLANRLSNIYEIDTNDKYISQYIFFFFSIRPVPASRIESVYTFARPEENGTVFSYENKNGSMFSIIIISGYKSVVELNENFNYYFSKYVSNTKKI